MNKSLLIASFAILTASVLGMDTNSFQKNDQKRKWFNAVRKNDLNSMKELVKKGLDLCVQDNQGNTALILASRNGYFGMVKWIIDQIIDRAIPFLKSFLTAYSKRQPLNNNQISQLYDKIFTNFYSPIDISNFGDYSEPGEYTAVQMAAKYGHTDIVRYLIKQGADIHNNQEGIVPLLFASTKEHENLMKYWMEKCMDTSKGTCTSKTLETAYKNFIEHLIKHGAETSETAYAYKNFIEHLIEHDADVNEETLSGVTPLLFAVGQGYEDTVKYLLEKGADIGKANKYKETPLMIALLCKRENLAKYLVKENKANVRSRYKYIQNLPLSIASRLGQINLVKYLVDNGAEVNLWGEYSDALRLAAREGHIDVVRYLVTEKAKVNSAIHPAAPPLIEAIIGGHENVIKYLIEHKADVNIQADNSSTTPLIMASSLGNENIVKYLVEHGAYVNWTNQNGETPLFLSTMRNETIVKYLVEHGADTNKANSHGLTTLHKAAYFGNKAIIKYLVEHGALIDKESVNGFTPLWFAVNKLKDYDKEKKDIVQYLVEHGADMSKANLKVDNPESEAQFWNIRSEID